MLWPKADSVQLPRGCGPRGQGLLRTLCSDLSVGELLRSDDRGWSVRRGGPQAPLTPLAAPPTAGCTAHRHSRCPRPRRRPRPRPGLAGKCSLASAVLGRPPSPPTPARTSSTMSPFSACTWATAPRSRMMLKTSYIWAEGRMPCGRSLPQQPEPPPPAPSPHLTWPSVHWHLSLYAMKTRKEFTPAAGVGGGQTLSFLEPPLLPHLQRGQGRPRLPWLPPCGPATLRERMQPRPPNPTPL